MSYQMIKTIQIGTVYSPHRKSLWLGMVNVSADDTVISDSPTVSALTKRLKLKNRAKAAAEKL